MHLHILMWLWWTPVNETGHGRCKTIRVEDQRWNSIRYTDTDPCAWRSDIRERKRRLSLCLCVCVSVCMMGCVLWGGVCITVWFWWWWWCACVCLAVCVYLMVCLCAGICVGKPVCVWWGMCVCLMVCVCVCKCIFNGLKELGIIHVFLLNLQSINLKLSFDSAFWECIWWPAFSWPNEVLLLVIS